ncbi:MAG: hypothetical protein AAF601_10665 [Pseudomonadota bacterium]
MRREVFLHAGAHRTGTSSFQLCLASNATSLRAAGYDLGFPRREGIAGGNLHLRLPRPKHSDDDMPAFVAKVRRALTKHVTAQNHRLILSDENLPGVILHMLKGKLYPNRRQRIEVFQQALAAIDGHVSHILFVIRPYDQLFMSGYRKHAEDNPLRPFEQTADAMSRFTGGWPDTVHTLHTLLRPDRFTVVDYAKRGTSVALLERLLGTPHPQFQEPEQALNISATDAALQHLQAIYHSGQTLERSAWSQAISTFSQDTADRGFARFSAPQARRLQARYQQDLEKIAALPGVTLVA